MQCGASSLCPVAALLTLPPAFCCMLPAGGQQAAVWTAVARVLLPGQSTDLGAALWPVTSFLPGAPHPLSPLFGSWRCGFGAGRRGSRIVDLNGIRRRLVGAWVAMSPTAANTVANTFDSGCLFLCGHGPPLHIAGNKKLRITPQAWLGLVYCTFFLGIVLLKVLNCRHWIKIHCSSLPEAWLKLGPPQCLLCGHRLPAKYFAGICGCVSLGGGGACVFFIYLASLLQCYIEVHLAFSGQKTVSQEIWRNISGFWFDQILHEVCTPPIIR